jgi:hypothetical protein
MEGFLIFALVLAAIVLLSGICGSGKLKLFARLI